MKHLKKIWIEAEHWAARQWNVEDANTDVIVTFVDGREYVATFFTYKNLRSLVAKNRLTGECLDGKYFWASDMILIDNCSRESIEKVIYHLLKEDEFEEAFREIRE